MTDKIREELKSLFKKADQVRSIHGLIKQRYEGIQKWVMLFVTIGSAVAAMLIFSSIPEEYKIWVGLLSALIFIVSLIPGTLKYDSKIQERAVAVQLWGEWVRDARNFLNVELSTLEAEEAKAAHNRLLADYKKTMSKTPDIPDSFFNKGKRRHLQKVAISKALDANPFKSIRTIKEELKKGQK